MIALRDAGGDETAKAALQAWPEVDVILADLRAAVDQAPAAPPVAEATREVRFRPSATTCATVDWACPEDVESTN